MVSTSSNKMELQQTKWEKFKSFMIECRRVLTVTKKPTNHEFKTIMKVSGVGILAIGLLGFIIQLLKELITKGLQ